MLLAGLAATGGIFWGLGLDRTPRAQHPVSLELKPAARYVVDASPYGMDGVLYRSEPVVKRTVVGFYPGNGTVLAAMEAVQYPNWIMADNGYWLPLEIDGKVCIRRMQADDKR
ncbi:hypothetical protein DIPPA_30807 [Diplonema papillatum]|nr:hypothetical protein DIPPA_30807 [Diplonema papillatum]